MLFGQTDLSHYYQLFAPSEDGPYLTVVIDFFSQGIVGWATSSTIRGELVLDTTLNAVRALRTKGAVTYSDQTSQYGREVWRPLRLKYRPEPSMVRSGNHRDIAVAESFSPA